MKKLGIIAEYNPLHNGHIHHLRESIAKTNSDLVIVIMSGSFTQQGNIAILDKFTRAKLATLYGADIVIELPTIFAISSAEYFAKASINILNSLGVNYLSFGSEEENISNLVTYTKQILQNEDKIDKKIKMYLKEGFSYTKSYISAVEDVLDVKENLFKSNNILGIEYLKAIYGLNSPIEPFCIKRISNNFSDETLSNSTFSSATSIRLAIESSKDVSTVKEYIPTETLNALNLETISFNNSLYELFRYTVLSKKNTLKNIQGVTEGIENRIYKSCVTCNNYADFLEKTVTRRFTAPKIKRLILNILLNITKEDFSNINFCEGLYARILATSEKGKKNLGKLTRESTIPIITKLNDNIINELDAKTQKLLNLDILASNIWNIVNKKELDSDYKNKL